MGPRAGSDQGSGAGVAVASPSLSTFDALRRLPELACCSPRQLREIAARCDEVLVLAGARVAADGASLGRSLLVVDGRVDVTSREVVVSSSGPGELVGQIGCSPGGDSALTATAAVATRLLSIGPGVLDVARHIGAQLTGSVTYA